MPHCLLIDDDPMEWQLVTTLAYVYASHWRVTCVSSLAEAFVLLQAHHPPIDLVLLDLHFPDTHGIRTLQLFYAQVPDYRVVVLTGVDEDLVAPEVQAHGAGFLGKTQLVADPRAAWAYLDTCAAGNSVAPTPQEDPSQHA